MVAEAIVAALLSFPPWDWDRREAEARYCELPAEEVEAAVQRDREALARPVAEAIAAVAETRTEAAFLATQAIYESRLARYVLEDRCHEGPPFARCDGGRATGPWQVHSWCVGAFDIDAGRDRRLEAGATCALQLARHGLHRCGDWSGAFAAQGQSECGAAWAAEREVRMWAVWRLL